MSGFIFRNAVPVYGTYQLFSKQKIDDYIAETEGIFNNACPELSSLEEQERVLGITRSES
jgi:hypothetical protein